MSVGRLLSDTNVPGHSRSLMSDFRDGGQSPLGKQRQQIERLG